METMSAGLRDFFAGAVYPLIVLLTCLLVFGTVVFVAVRAKTPRAVIAAIVPVVALPFLVVSHESVGDPLLRAVDRLTESARFVIGALVAILLIEIGKILLRKESEIGPALFIFFLGSAGTFFVYALMSNGLAVAHFIFFGFVVGGGIYMIFRGVPVPERLLRDWPLGTGVRKALSDVARTGRRSESAKDASHAPAVPGSNASSPPRSEFSPTNRSSPD